jgi:hypothetical protein
MAIPSFVGALLLLTSCNAFIISPYEFRTGAWKSSRRNGVSSGSADGDGQALLDWLAQEAGVAAPLSVGPSTHGGGQGLFVTQSVAKGDILFELPEEVVISVEDAWQDAELGDSFCYLTDEGGQAGKMASLAGFCAKERLFNRENSSWFPYLELLPTTAADQDHVLWWSDEEVETLLAGSNVYNQVVRLRADTDSALEILWEVLLQTELKTIELPAKSVWDDSVRSAYVSILSRAFEDDAVDSSKLLPVLDMTQHTAEPNLVHSTNPSTGSVVVKAGNDLKEGQELTIEYSQDMPKHEFFVYYGFVPGEQQSCRQLLKARSPVFFPL